MPLVNKHTIRCECCGQDAIPGTAYIQKDGAQWWARHIGTCPPRPSERPPERHTALAYAGFDDDELSDVTAAEFHDHVGVDGSWSGRSWGRRS